MIAVDGRPPLWWVLLRHEGRLTVRDLGWGSRRARDPTRPAKVVGRKRRIAGIVGVAVLLHLGGALSLVLPRRWNDSPTERVAAAAVLLLLFTLMLSTAMSRIVAAFHERRDLDLLLSAPVAPATLLVVRALTVVFAVTCLFAVFVYPLADVGVASGRWWLGRLYGLVPLMALTATAVALALTGAVVRLVGVRRARVGLQVFSAVVGASFYLVSQARQFLPDGASARWVEWTRRAAQDEGGAWPIDVAARLARGDGLAWLGFAFVACALFAASVWSARKRFVELAQMPEADAPTAASPRDRVDRRIATGFDRRLLPTLLAKEWRLILRAPQLISQILLQLLYLMPLLFVAFNRKGGGVAWGAAAFAAGIVGVAGTLATSLAWLTVSAEDAPDLLAGSPQGRRSIVAAKLLAASLPPVALIAIAAVGTLGRSAIDASLVLVFGVLACTSAAILAAASPTSARRTDFQRRHRGRGWMAVVESVQFLLWAGATGTAVSGLWWVAVPLTIVALVVPGLALRRALTSSNDLAGPA